MPFVYGVDGAPASPYATHATPNSEDLTLATRQVTRGHDVQAIYVAGRGAALTAITGIGYRVKRHTTAGTGGGSITPAPRRIGTTAVTTAHDKTTAFSGSPVSGGVQVGFGCGAAGPGGWVARDADSCIHIEAGSADECAIFSVSGVASMLHAVSAEIVE